MKYEEILKVVPIREPVLGVDDIVEVKYGESVVGYRNIRKEQPWAKGHFLENPIFPGTMIIETMAQICSFILYKEGVTESLKAYLVKINNVKFKKSVIPDCRLYIHCKCKQIIGHVMVADCKAVVDGKEVASGEITLYFIDEIDS